MGAGNYSQYDDDEDDDGDLLFTHGLHGIVLHVDDRVRISYRGEMREGEIIQIAKNGRYLKVQLESGEVVDVLLTHIEEIV